MDEIRFLMWMKKARNFSHLGDRPDYWRGYQRGLRRGFQGELFGTEEEHKRWMRLADDGVDEAERERGRGYRDALVACAAADDDALVGLPRNRGGDNPKVHVNSFPFRRR